MATHIWSRVRARVHVSPAPRGDRIRQATLRLAALTVGLLLVMLLVLEIVTYTITQHAFLSTLNDTLKARASQTDPSVCAELNLPCAPPGGPHPGGNPQANPQDGGPGFGSGPGRFPGYGSFGSRPRGPSEASSVYLDSRLHIIHAESGRNAVILDRSEARLAIATKRAQCCAVDRYQEVDYRIYTSPIVYQGKVVGVVQASISQHQYDKTMQALRNALLLVTLLGLLASAGISAILVHRALQPVESAMQRQRDFVADAAHELRTPLAIMRTVGEVGMSSPSAEELQATLAQMLGENQHLTRLVDDLSLLARTDTDAVDIERRPLDLSSLMSETVEELGYVAEEQGVRLEADIQDGVQLFGDTVRLRQLLLILLDNALKHTPEGGSLQVGLSVHGGRARLQVTDSGPGIAPDDLPQIFNRFYRADKSRTGEGSGLGLAIGKWIVDAHGGQIQAGNVTPHGARFTVTLPITRVAVAAEHTPQYST